VSETARANPGWTDSNYLKEVEVTTAGKIIVKGDMKNNPSGCKDGESYYIDSSRKDSEKIYQLLLDSVTSGNPVKLYVTGVCELSGMSEISSVKILSK